MQAFIASALGRGEWLVSRPDRFNFGKEHLYPRNRSLGGPQSRSGCSSEEKNSQPLTGLEPPIIQPVAQRYTTLFRPPYTVSVVKILQISKGNFGKHN